MKNKSIYYSVGALLYCPANNESIVKSIISERFGKLYSLALCLEDTIGDEHVEEAEEILIHSLNSICEHMNKQPFYLPKIFIRVRKASQIQDLVNRLGIAVELLTGFIIPKITIDNLDSYIEEIKAVNKDSRQPIYMLPILESTSIINLQNRHDILYAMKAKFDEIEELILNIRVGGNDLCHAFGFRRSSYQSIHNIFPIANIFSDIITIFGIDYVVSGPVWEYYRGDNWAEGLSAEIEQDLLSGFIGKTVIHPNQIEVVNEGLKVSREDYEDAKSIMNWDKKSNSYVSGNVEGKRMNEYKTHMNWAEKILFRAEIYGISN
ncbi:MAG: HpcH/HpaI aldolase/citrate lyase family protein [Lachnospiraceae bacterium]|nr:HpcH/HpaI aldolase/citrate lyase family protein [Lachnospiraceae bacterium]